ncbi:NAD(P)H-hydrate dehydratase [Dyadobacter sp. LHD-138]|uniref:NAD(P)H-hydrate dehydratase n=1 Tax=Dyadobacter sp. LHD-138 TaxID=3071413 RepID=UPI0027E0DEBA|nr:NAD(P)H-hydrate dehydratase [Dyadobacter sp. LHD-138]MDQ6476751.1 NAD(P)H-hydrate dehydratase [Dyadobacter sp. LHD-138]
MKILNAEHIRALDAHTIKNEPISSFELMERASHAFVKWFTNCFDISHSISVFCGKGNNGGDGLAIARILSSKGYHIRVFVIEYTNKMSDDFTQNLKLIENHLQVQSIYESHAMPEFNAEQIIIDALLGSGLSRPVTGLLEEVIETINEAPATVVSVDIASGLYVDKPNGKSDAIITPDYTVTFQLPKLTFMMPQNAAFTGDWRVVDIGLDTKFIEQTDTPYYFTDKSSGEALIKKRKKFSHKGTFGHALILAGSYGKIGAAVLSARACLRSGVGLLTVHLPECGYGIMQISLPEAMVSVDPHDKNITTLPELDSYSAIGMGPGIGQEPLTVRTLDELLDKIEVPLILDADALNILSKHPDLLDKLPSQTILSPHPKEFQRLAGDSANEFERLELARNFTRKHNVIICLKGAYTAVILANGDVHFNSTGNAGMATGGSGDVLTGILTALLAQNYTPENAAILGVYQHGLAGDRAADKKTKTAMIASDIIENLGW